MKEKLIISISLLIMFVLIFSISYAQQQIIYSLSMIVCKNDTVVLKNITAINGIPGEFSDQETNYNIKVLSQQDLELFSDNIWVSFFLSLDPIGVIETNTTFVYVNVPYFQTAKTISIYHLDKKILNIDLNEELCNKNNICDLGENEYNCPEDCSVACRDQNYECTIDDIPCCPGLKEVTLAYEDEEGKCIAPVPCGSICVPCGDGICEGTRFENKCNCPEDCKEPAKFPWVYVGIGFFTLIFLVIIIMKAKKSKTNNRWGELHQKWK